MTDMYCTWERKYETDRPSFYTFSTIQPPPIPNAPNKKAWHVVADSDYRTIGRWQPSSTHQPYGMGLICNLTFGGENNVFFSGIQCSIEKCNRLWNLTFRVNGIFVQHTKLTKAISNKTCKMSIVLFLSMICIFCDMRHDLGVLHSCSPPVFVCLGRSLQTASLSFLPQPPAAV